MRVAEVDEHCGEDRAGYSRGDFWGTMSHSRMAALSAAAECAAQASFEGSLIRGRKATNDRDSPGKLGGDGADGCGAGGGARPWRGHRLDEAAGREVTGASPP